MDSLRIHFWHFLRRESSFIFGFIYFIFSAASFQLPTLAQRTRLHFSSKRMAFDEWNALTSIGKVEIVSTEKIDGQSKWRRYMHVKVHSGFGSVGCATECGASGHRVSASHSELLCCIL